MCQTCNGSGRQYEIDGAVRVVKPCPNCPDDVREERKRRSYEKLLANIERANATLKRMEGEMVHVP